MDGVDEDMYEVNEFGKVKEEDDDSNELLESERMMEDELLTWDEPKAQEELICRSLMLQFLQYLNAKYIHTPSLVMN